MKIGRRNLLKLIGVTPALLVPGMTPGQGQVRPGAKPAAEPEPAPAAPVAEKPPIIGWQGIDLARSYSTTGMGYLYYGSSISERWSFATDDGE